MAQTVFELQGLSSFLTHIKGQVECVRRRIFFGKESTTNSYVARQELEVIMYTDRRTTFRQSNHCGYVIFVSLVLPCFYV